MAFKSSCYHCEDVGHEARNCLDGRTAVMKKMKGSFYCSMYGYLANSNMQSQIIFLVVLVAFAVADHSGEKNRVCTPACVDGQVCGHDNKCFTLPKCEPACVEPQKCGWQSQCFTPVECSPACAQGQFCNPMNGTCMAPPAGGWGAHHGVAQAPTA